MTQFHTNRDRRAIEDIQVERKHGAGTGLAITKSSPTNSVMLKDSLFDRNNVRLR